MIGLPRGTLLAVLLLAACGSSPDAQFFALDPAPPHAERVDATGAPLTLDTVRLPSILDRPELVARGAGGVVEVSKVRRWAAPLDEMTQKVLAENLTARLPPGMVIEPGMPVPPGPTRALAVSLDEFDAGPDGRVILEGDWTVSAGSPPRPVLHHHERIEETKGANQAVVMSAALGRLADRIATQLQNAPSSAK